MRYPPVGASQSSISPAQKIPGFDFSIKLWSRAFLGTPPAVDIASSMGCGPSCGISRFLEVIEISCLEILCENSLNNAVFFLIQA